MLSQRYIYTGNSFYIMLSFRSSRHDIGKLAKEF